MTKINTVSGPIDADALGLTLPHEHIIAAYPGWECDPLIKPYNREKNVDVCLKALEPVKTYGVKTIIDATPVDLARNVDVMKDVSEKLHINIVCATGRYSQAEGKWSYLQRRAAVKVGSIRTELYEGMMKEITEGIGESGIRPGVIKIATGREVFTPCEEALFRAAAQASRETGIPIMTHTEDGMMGPEQADLLISEGANPRKIVIGHMCGNPSMSYQLDVLSRGVYIAFDRFGIEMLLSDQVRTAVLIGLLGLGYADRIMISHDCAASTYSRGGRMPMEEAVKFKNWSFTNIFRNILPALKKAGVTEDQIQTMMVDNPRRFLSLQSK